MPADLKSNKKLTTDRKAVVFLLGFTLVNGWLIDKKHAVIKLPMTGLGYKKNSDQEVF